MATIKTRGPAKKATNKEYNSPCENKSIIATKRRTTERLTGTHKITASALSMLFNWVYT